MYKCSPISLLLLLINFLAFTNASYYIMLSSDSPTVRGGTVHFVARLYDDSGHPVEESLQYSWTDNSIVGHKARHDSKSAVDTWNVTYPANNNFPPGPYEVQVLVCRDMVIFCYDLTSQRLTFELTENLNGALQLSQKNKTIQGKYISNADEVTHRVILNKPDADYLNKTATSIVTYWFIDCVYYGMTDDFTFNHTYSDVDKKHQVEALVVAGYEPITTPAPSTTTAPTTTTSKPLTTTTAATTTSKPNVTVTVGPTKPSKTNSISHNLNRIKRASIDNTSHIMAWKNGTLVQYNQSFPFVCLKNNTIAPDPNKTYGYFRRRFSVKAPISNISISGNYWLHKGDVLQLTVKCHGTPQFYYCMHFFEGVYNVTGNETCTVPTPLVTDVCEFPIARWYKKPQKYTIAIVIYNDVGKIVSPVTVTVYEVAKQAQLSVVVVPVAFGLVAVVLIVFGVAYHMQNRRRFTVEVADFNFGQQGSDLEYKTFRERLRDSISNAFMRAPTPGSSEPTVWPPGRKYGSLT